ncbi:MAG TPA: hypothetical protein VHP38_09635 [Ruminiclostridium sp.]|nr:hypothetical protein [Ruminiclostridium sp.]
MSVTAVLKIGHSTYSFYNHLSELNDIYDKIADVYLDVAKSHVLSAKVSVNNAFTSSDPKSEIRHSIHHLVDAYYILHTLKTKEKKLSILDRLDGVDKKLLFSDTRFLKLCTLNIGLIIYYFYLVIGDTNSASSWLATLQNDYITDNTPEKNPVYSEGCDDKTFIKILKEFKKYRYFNSSHLYIYESEYSVLISRLQGMRTYTQDVYEITSEGKNFYRDFLIDSLKEKVKKVVNDQAFDWDW